MQGYRNQSGLSSGLIFSPPLRGGMIDLEYFAVSQYEMDQHPDLSAIMPSSVCSADWSSMSEKTVFRLRARYDRERAFDFGDISQKNRHAVLPRSAPDGPGLEDRKPGLPESARSIVAGAWSEFFASWGVFRGRGW